MNSPQIYSIRAGQRKKDNLPERQEILYESILIKVEAWEPEAVLEYFKQIFIEQSGSTREAGLSAVFDIADANIAEVFHNTFKRCCYILINNWESSRNSSYVRDLIRVIPSPVLYRRSTSPLIRRIRAWVLDFIESDSFQEIKFFSDRFEERQRTWTQRYAYYFLVSQSVDQDNPQEQREAARNLSKTLRKRFASNLAHYLAHSQLNSYSAELSASQSLALVNREIPENPTGLGQEAIRLIKSIIMRKGQFSYENLANIFREQVRGLTYKEYKASLIKYLIFSISQEEVIGSFSQILSEKLNDLYAEKDDALVDAGLQLRTCNQVIRLLTVEDEGRPSNLFLILVSCSASLTLSVLLLKTLLLCPNARSFLDLQIAKLVQHYRHQDDKECAWFTSFLDILSVTVSIYLDGTRYDLVRVSDGERIAHQAIDSTSSLPAAEISLDQYQLFSQLRLASRVKQAIDMRAKREMAHLDYSEHLVRDD